MIRPSPTSISISAQDVAFHSQQIEVYHGLLKQGFKRKEIRRYFREQQQTIIKGDQHATSADKLQGPSWVELAGRVANSASNVEEHYRSRSLETTNRSTYSDRHDHGRSDFTGDQLDRDHQQKLSATTQTISNIDTPAYEQQDRVTSGEVYRRHAPRQSSLLRFSSNFSSEEQASPQLPSPLTLPVRPKLKYRPRTETYSYEQSDLEDGMSTSSSLATVFQDLLLDDSLVLADPTTEGDQTNAEEVELPGNTSTPVIVEGSLSVVDVLHAYNQQSSSDQPSESTARIVPRLQPRNSVARLPPMNTQTTSPVLVSHSEGEDTPARLSPTLPSKPRTPRSAHRKKHVNTEPYAMRPRYFDGQSFTPYNDSIPADLQPQTPADLSRHTIIDETSATYTGRPGTLRASMSGIRREYEAETEPGLESPTNRAISMRRRRNVEYARSARIESLRIARSMRRPRVEQESDQNNTRLSEDVQGLDEQMNLWRDDLDADRVGEENFEDDETVFNTAGVRVRALSGNRRTYGL